MNSKHTKALWHACHNGKCSCKQIWCDDYPIATVISGKWGDDYPSIRLTGNSLDLKAEAYMEQISYGEINEEEAKANIRLMTMAPKMYKICKHLLDNPYLDASAYYDDVSKIIDKIDLLEE